MLNFLKLILAAVFLSRDYTVWAADWSYVGDHGPDHWPGVCNTGMAQSPIDIDVHEVKKDLPALKFEDYDDKPRSMSIENNGHTAQILISAESPPFISGGGVEGSYILVQAHFHWKSEHTIFGKRYPLEMHFVHKLTENRQPVRDRDRYLVVGVMFEVGEKNEHFQPIVDALDNIKIMNSKANVMDPPSFESVLPEHVGEFFTYNGSLTTPPCSEVVSWFVLKNTITISEEQVSKFKMLKSSDMQPLEHNFRPIQPLNARKVYLRTGSKDEDDDSAGYRLIGNPVTIFVTLTCLLVPLKLRKL